MKSRLFFLFFCIATASPAWAQKVAYTQQEFVLRDVQMTQDPRAFNRRLAFSFRILGKYGRDQVESEPGGWRPGYMLEFWLTDAQGDTLVSPGADKSALQSFSFFDTDTGKYKSYSFAHNIYFPFQHFKKSGNLNVTLWGRAQNADGSIKLKPFKAGTYAVAVPQLYPFAAQKITTRNAAAVTAAKNNTQGVAVRFDAEFMYDAGELYTDAESSDLTTFFVEFTQADGSPVTATGDPSITSTGRNGLPQFETVQRKNATTHGEIFFPYTLFYLPPGIHTLNYKLHAVSDKFSRHWPALAEGKITINMPSVYFAKATVKNIQVAEKSYDISANSIPFGSLFVSQKSKSGKGYPDLFWRLETDYQNILTSQTVTNSFRAVDDSCYFQMLAGDRLYLNVYDYDVFSRNDLLGGFGIQMNDKLSYRAEKLRNDDVTNGEIYIERRPRPTAPAITLHVETVNSLGVSGYRIKGNITENGTPVQTRFFLRMPDGSNQVPDWKKMVPENGEGFAYFIPAWEYPKGAGVGVLTTDPFFRLPLGQQYVTPAQTLTETDDVKLQVEPLQATVRNGVNGLLLNITAIYPAGLADKSICRFRYELKDMITGSNLADIIDKFKVEGSPFCPKSECGVTLFVPFYALRAYANQQIRAVFKSWVTVAKNNFVIGRNEEVLEMQIPEIVSAPKAEFSGTLKMKKNWTYVEIATRYNGEKKVLVKEKSEGGKFATEISFPSEYMCKDDTLSLIVTPYEFRTSQPEIRWTFTAKELLEKKTLALKKVPEIKKPVLTGSW